MLELNNINFKYPKQETFSVRIPHFKLEKGEIIYLKGHSGCGKTTLLNLLTGVIDSPISSEVKLYYPRIEYVMHESKLLPWLNIRKNINVFEKLSNSKIDFEVFTKYCKDFNLSFNINKQSPKSLSLGMRQRTEVAISLASMPNLLVLDEGLSGIDIKNKEKVSIEIFKYIKTHDCSFIGTAHQISDVLRLATKLYIMDNGKIIDEIGIRIPVEERLQMDVSKLLTLDIANKIIDS